MNEMDLSMENFMLYCDSKNLTKKTLVSYEQTLKLFVLYLEREHKIKNVEKVKPSHKDFVNKIGNLTLLGSSLNILSSNNPFIEKKKNYQQSTIQVTRDICK